MVTGHPEYCKTLYFRCILISRFWNVEILLHFNLAFSHCSISIYQAFDGQTEFSRVFNFAILSDSQKFDAREKYTFYSIKQQLESTGYSALTLLSRLMRQTNTHTHSMTDAE